MWTVFQAKLQTVKTDSSNPNKDTENFKNLISDLFSKLESIKNGRGDTFYKDKNGDLHITDHDGTTITLTENGIIDVSHPAA